jgi:hypothetical protein
VWAAPFDVMYDLVSARAVMMDQAFGKQTPTPPPSPENDRYAHLPPGVQMMIAKLQGRAR